MKRKSISLIMALMSFALLGVMAMQYYFIKESYGLKSQLFDQSVNDALNKVSDKLEKKEAMVYLAQKAEKDFKINEDNWLEEQRAKNKEIARENARVLVGAKRRLKVENATIEFVQKMKAFQAKSDSLFVQRDSFIRHNYPNRLVYNGPATPDSMPFRVNFKIDVDEVTDAFGVVRNVVRRSIIETPSQPVSFKMIKRGSPVIDTIRRYMVEDPILGTVLKTIPKPNYLTGISEKELLLASKKRQIEKEGKKVSSYLEKIEREGSKGNVFRDIASEMQQANIPLEKRIHPQTIDSLLAQELANHGINLNYSYRISSIKEDSVIFTKALQSNQTFIPANTYKTVLFSKDMVRDAGYLTITFPEKNSLLINNMATILFSSAALLFVLAASFIYTISSILRQKKVSEMKNDFINNMTHEFKTPVATIMIASEALKDPEINENKARVNKLAGIIYDENVRLGNHIERVLNIAKVEKEDVKLENTLLPMHDVIANVIDSMNLQLQKREAKVSLLLDASKATIMGDELHLSNIIFNLVDNAIKYCTTIPEITISTHNEADKLIVKIADNGIGMNRDQQKKIFEQFYRIPTGNLHDVKGFGLGLSYVSNMIKKMNGNIAVKSEKGVGSEFEIKFPLA